MAITDNSFTPEEFTAAITAKPELFAHVQTAFKGMGHHAIKKDEYDTFVSTEREKIAGEKTKEIYTAIDNDVLTVSGVPKASADEKTYDYVKRVLGTHKTGSEALNNKIKDLEAKIAAGGDQAMKDQLTALQAKAAKLEQEEIPGYQKQLFAKDVEIDVRLGLAGIKLRSDLPQVLVKPALQAVMNSMVAQAKKDANGNIYYVDKDGRTILDGVNTASAEYVLKNHPDLKELIDDGSGKQGGGGSGQPGAGGTGGSTTEVKNKDGQVIVIPADVKTKTALHEFLCSQGLSADSKEFNELYFKYSKDANGKDLPLR